MPHAEMGHGRPRRVQRVTMRYREITTDPSRVRVKVTRPRVTVDLYGVTRPLGDSVVRWASTAISARCEVVTRP